MAGFFARLFRLQPAPDYHEMVKGGALILDVRTREEFNSGHIKGAVNVPLNELPREIAKLKKERTIITCCASGMRSASAKRMLRSRGFGHVFNGGGWISLQNKIG